jgi:hypothetical protein
MILIHISNLTSFIKSLHISNNTNDLESYQQWLTSFIFSLYNPIYNLNFTNLINYFISSQQVKE